MSSLKEIKNRIASVQSTRKITSAMKMVSSAKLHQAEGVMERLRPYERKLDELLGRLLASDSELDSPYAAERPLRNATLVAFSSNTGLCGAFNATVIRALFERLHAYEREGVDVRLYAAGKKVAEALEKEGYKAHVLEPSFVNRPDYGTASELADELGALFLSGATDRIELLFHPFKGAASQLIACQTWLPVTLPPEGDRTEYLIEPSAEDVLAVLVPRVLRLRLYGALLDTVTAEHAARVLAMQTATDNATDLLNDLTLLYNKSRQQAITNELLDIAGGRA